MDFTIEQLRALLFQRNSAQFRTLPHTSAQYDNSRISTLLRAIPCNEMPIGNSS